MTTPAYLPPPGGETFAERLVRTTKRRARSGDPMFYLLIMFMAISVVFIFLWARTIYAVRVELNLLQVAYDAHIRERVVKDEAWRAEFDTIYQTLYSPPEAKTPEPRRPSAVELWQVNRDAELRKRLQALEQWRYREERR